MIQILEFKKPFMIIILPENFLQGLLVTSYMEGYTNFFTVIIEYIITLYIDS